MSKIVYIRFCSAVQYRLCFLWILARFFSSLIKVWIIFFNPKTKLYRYLVISFLNLSVFLFFFYFQVIYLMAESQKQQQFTQHSNLLLALKYVFMMLVNSTNPTHPWTTTTPSPFPLLQCLSIQLWSCKLFFLPFSNLKTSPLPPLAVTFTEFFTANHVGRQQEWFPP